MKNKNGIRLNNLIFPIYMFAYLFPSWIYILVLAGNWLIDWAVLRYSIQGLDLENAVKKDRHLIWKIWGCGLLADFITAFIFFVVYFYILIDIPAYFSNALAYNPWSDWTALFIMLGFVLLGGLLVYILDFKLALRKLEISKDKKHRLALRFGILTAPWLFLLPTAWFF